MKLSEVRDILNARVLVGESQLNREVSEACGSDLMSDVLAFSKEKVLLLTGLMNAQVIRTAEMLDIKAVAFLRGKDPIDDVLRLAEEKNIVVMASDLNMFVACGKLYEGGLGKVE